MSIKFVSSTADDTSQIQQWTDADIYHRGQHNPGWWITGNGLLSFCLHDDQGPCFYVRIDDGEYASLSVQFAPEDVVSKRRLVHAILQALPKIIGIIKANGSKGLIFDSVSPSLVRFMEKVGFKQVQESDSYKLSFGE